MIVLFDGNYLFHKTLSVVKSGYEKELRKDLSISEFFEEKENQARFFRKVIIDFCNTVRLFDNVTKVIFVFDNPSFRKDFYPSYKNKSKNEIDVLVAEENKEGYTIFYNLMEKFSSLVNKRGFIIKRGMNFEGDDLCGFYSKKFVIEKTNCLIISGDKDLLQLINNNVAVYRNNSMSPSFFCVKNDYFGEVYQKISKKYKQTKYEIVEPNEFLFKKLLSGDSGDNIPNLFKGLGSKKIDEIYDFCVEKNMNTLDFGNEEYFLQICKIIKSKCKSSPEIEEIQMRLIENIQLMCLNDLVYSPEQIKFYQNEILNSNDEFTFNKEYNLTEILN